MKKLINDLKPSNIFSMTTFLDKLLFVLLIIFSVTSFFFVKELFPSSGFVKISVDNKTGYTLPLNKDCIVTVKGSLGENLIEIKNGKVHMKDAPCPKKLCIHQGWIDRGTIICLPNKVVVTVGGNEQNNRASGYDAVSK